MRAGASVETQSEDTCGSAADGVTMYLVGWNSGGKLSCLGFGWTEQSEGT